MVPGAVREGRAALNHLTSRITLSTNLFVQSRPRF
jgi:hypothetical protein